MRVRSIYLAPYVEPDPPPLVPRDPWAPELDPEAEAELDKIMALLRAIAAGTERSEHVPEPPKHALPSVLGGTELVMRWRYLDGRAFEVPRLLPGALFLVTVLFLARDEALRRSEEAHRLVLAAGF